MFLGYDLLFNYEKTNSESERKIGELEEDCFDPLPRFAEKESLRGCDEEEDWEDISDYGPSSHLLY